MANPSEIVAVTITVQDAVAAEVNFGSILIVANAPYLAGTIQTYDVSAAGLAAMITDGFTQGSAAYLMVSRLAAQNPTVTQVKIYSRTTTNAQEIVCTPLDTTEDYVYTFNVVNPAGTSTEIEYTVLAAATPTSISTAIAALVNAITGVDGTDNTGTFSISPTTSGTRVHVSSMDPQISCEDTSADAGIATDLAAALVADSDFYGVLIDSNCKAELVAAAAWATSNKKIILGLSIDSEIDDAGVSDDVCSTIKATGTDYANVVYTREHASYANAGLLGRQFALDPGSSSWSNKKVTGVTVDTFTATEHSVARGKQALLYETYLGLPMIRNGEAAGGRFFDITHGKDWLTYIIQAALLAYLAKVEKIDYTDEGIGEVEGVIRGQLGLAAQVRFITEDSIKVNVPKAADVSAADKANRQLNGVTFSATLAGAIHSTVIAGTISV